MTAHEKVNWKVKTIDLYQEPCDCGDRILHNNGGNYHRITRTVTVRDGEGNAAVLIENTTTRETFPRDDLDVLTFDSACCPSWALVPQEWVDEPILHFISGEAHLLYTLVSGEEQQSS